MYQCQAFFFDFVDYYLFWGVFFYLSRCFASTCASASAPFHPEIDGSIERTYFFRSWVLMTWVVFQVGSAASEGEGVVSVLLRSSWGLFLWWDGGRLVLYADADGLR